MTTDVRLAGEVLATLVRLVTDVVGEDFLLDTELTMETSFSDDLELESIEFVVLAERLEETYGQRVDFASWVGDMELEELMGLTVGQLVEFIVSCLS